MPRDVVAVGDRLLFGYNVFLGLKPTTEVCDVFALHRFTRQGDELALAPVPAGDPADFLADPAFVKDFHELYRYYKETRLLQLRKREGRLLAVFQCGRAATDLRVFRWTVFPDGKVAYVDNRGERDNVFPPTHDFEWTRATRDDFVLGRHPHVSVFGEVFVETVGGDLTIKVEDNTEDGRGIWREAVEEPTQGLDDAEIHYARVGSLILLRVLPFRETVWRHLVFDPRAQRVLRIDAIGSACHQLPEDHGIIFPGGYYLENGDTRTFEGDPAGMVLTRVVRSPNGEDVLYVFHRAADGSYLLLPYNLIRKQVANPIHCHGYSLFGDGTVVLFRADSAEPVRVHPMQIWRTPFCSPEHAAAAPRTGSYLEKLGNAELVRAISEAFALERAVAAGRHDRRGLEELHGEAQRMADAHHWLREGEVGDLQAPLAELLATARLALDEIDKVEALRAAAAQQLADAEARVAALDAAAPRESSGGIEPLVAALTAQRRERGRLIALRDVRHVDRERLDALESQVVALFEGTAAATVELLRGDGALAPYAARTAELVAIGTAAKTTVELAPAFAGLEEAAEGLDLLTEVVGVLPIADPVARTAILESLAEVMAGLNRGRAEVAGHRRELLRREGAGEFAAQLKVLSQGVASALALADTPDKADAQLSRLLLQLEELEGRFAELDDLLGQLADKREEVVEAFAAKKEQLLEGRRRQASGVVQAAERILAAVPRRARALPSREELEAWFATDPMVAKLRDLAARLRELAEPVRADELEARLKAAREEATRALRDRLDLFDDDGAAIRLGRHRFAVNRQPFELTLVPHADGLAFHLTGTDFHRPIDPAQLATPREVWGQVLVSEDATVYRGEYLAACLLADAEDGHDGLSVELLRQEAVAGRLLQRVRAWAEPRYDEGYERGVHDADGAAILEALLSLGAAAGPLRHPPAARAAALLFWAHQTDRDRRERWRRRAASLARLRTAFARSPAIVALADELAAAVAEFHAELGLALHPEDARQAGAFLFAELAAGAETFTVGAEAAGLRDAFLAHLEAGNHQRAFLDDLRGFEGDLRHRLQLVRAWVEAYVEAAGATGTPAAWAVDEAVALLAVGDRQRTVVSQAQVQATVRGLLGQHARIAAGALELRLDELLARLGQFRHQRVPAFREWQGRRRALLEREAARLRVGELQPKVMTSFVRNRLIDEVYLPLVGDNLARQVGALGEGKQADRSGLLLLVSPPGYGKTTLMEYVAHRLGMAFVKVNGPALGHLVTSLDPAAAPDAPARQEVERINFAFECGNNVLLYLDDVQHTNPELLQKFVSLCDAQRRVDGVWDGTPRTWDLRGKRFAVCMAGNPYTESGQRFQVPDMLANRADVHNLGDVLSGREELFALSYLENAITSNPVLAPLAGGDPRDVDRLVRMARGEAVPADELSRPLAGAELADVLALLRKLVAVQEVMLAVNRQYILSASQDDAFRSEPRFQLQGSYRNMNRIAARVVPVMNDAELAALVTDHYTGEAQTLTTGAEANLLKLGELRGTLTPEQARRWEEIKKEVVRRRIVGTAGENDPVARVTGQLSLLAERVDGIGEAIAEAAARAAEARLAAEARAADGDGEGERGADAAAGWEGLAAALGPALERLHDGLVAALERPAVVALPVEPAVAAAGGEARAAAGAAPPVAGAGPAPDLTPYLAELNRTMAALATAPRGGAQVVQTLSPGVHELLGRMVTTIGDGLMSLLRSLARRAKEGGAPPDRRVTDLIDRLLKELDLLKELAEALRKLDTGALVAARREGEAPEPPA